MPNQRKLSKPTDQRLALIRGQVTELLWNGKIETTLARAKEVAREAEKIIALAIKTYKDTYTKVETRKVTGAKGKEKEIKIEMVNDGVKKLAARRKIMAFVYEKAELRQPKESSIAFKERTKGIKHPLIEKIFEELAPKYAQRAEELGQGGGYTRILKCGPRKGDAAEVAIIELI